LDWLVDHKGDFTLEAQRVLGHEIQVDWSRPRLILIAESFSDYDKYAVNRIGANIELWTYRRYGDEFLHLDPIFVAAPPAAKTPRIQKPDQAEHEKADQASSYTVQDHLEGKSRSTLELFERLRERILALGEEEVIIEKATKNYVAYKHGKNFCEIWIQVNKLKLWLDIAPADLSDPQKLGRDVTKIGHWGTGDVEVTLENPAHLDAVVTLVGQAYRQTL
jgi:predicted transport protein